LISEFELDDGGAGGICSTGDLPVSSLIFFKFEIYLVYYAF
jgi:hypothetical protein